MLHISIYMYLNSVCSVGEDNEWLVGKVEALLNVPGCVVSLHDHGCQQAKARGHKSHGARGHE